MQKTFITILILFVVVTWSWQVFADAEIKIRSKIEYHPPLKHTLKVYIDREKNVFWPMDKPVWIKLTTAPRDDAPSFLLENIYEKTETDQKKIENKGIKLEMPGRQFVRWADYLTKSEILLKFHADGIPPESFIALTGAPTFSGKSMFYGNGLKCRVSGKDDLSGVENVYISVNGDQFEIHSADLNLDTEKKYNIRYYAVDRVGYAAKPNRVDFIVDLTPPVTNHKIRKNFIGTTLSTTTEINPFSIDDLSDVKMIFYKFDDHKKFISYNQKRGIRLNTLSDGDHLLTYYAVDNVNNTELKREYKFYLDRKPAKMTHNFVGDLYIHNKMTFLSPRTRIMLKAQDNKAGVKEIQYRTNNSRYIPYTNPFAPPFKSGKFTVEFRVYDRLNNLSPPGKLSLMMDLTMPKTKYSIKGPGHVQGGVQWITSKTEIFLMSSDDLSGIKEIHFQLAKDPSQVYKAPLTVDTEGQFLFRYWATDNVNNIGLFSPILLIVDNTPPKIIEVFSIESIGESTNKKGIPVKVYPVYTTLFLGAMDNSAGLKKISYSLNKGPFKTYNETMLFTKKGNYSIDIRARDNVGNISSKSTSFVISD